MGARTKIEWATATWNPVRGCSKFSPGCDNCYAATMAARFQDNPAFKGLATFDKHGRAQWIGHIQLSEKDLDAPLHWKRPRRVFVCSTADLFHVQVPDSFIDKVLGVIRQTQNHQYILLTKRADRMVDYFIGHQQGRPVPQNAMVAVTIENADYLYRADELVKIPAKMRMLSIEPLIGPLDLRGILAGGNIHWVIVGGESGTRGRGMNEQWVIDIRDACQANKVAFFYKQRIDNGTKVSFPRLEGKHYAELPDGTSLL